MASAPETVTRVFPNPALTAAASLLDSQREMFGEPHAAFHRRLDALNQVFTERATNPVPFISAPELAAADIIALGKALPTSGNKPLVLAHAIMTIAALSTVAELQGKLEKELGSDGGTTAAREIRTALAGGNRPTFLAISGYDTPAFARSGGASEDQIQKWCEDSGEPYIAPAKDGGLPRVAARPGPAKAA